MGFYLQTIVFALVSFFMLGSVQAEKLVSLPSQSIDTEVRCGGGDGCGPGRPIFDYELAKRLFDEGVRPSESYLSGAWKYIAQAPSPLGAAAGYPRAYYPNGQKLRSGEYRGEYRRVLSFYSQESKWHSDEDFVMEFLNIVDPPEESEVAHQGPYTVAFSNGAACFSQLGYYRGWASLNNNVYSYQCRKVKDAPENSPKRIICSVTLLGIKEALTDSIRHLWGEVLYYRAFEKIE